MGKKFETVYRKKAQGKSLPRLGLPDSVRPGDWLTFFVDGAAYTREVASVHKGHFITCPLASPYGTIDKVRKVFWEDTATAERRLVPTLPPQSTHKPLPEPEPAPEPIKEAPLPVETEEALPEESLLDMWAILNDQ